MTTHSHRKRQARRTAFTLVEIIVVVIIISVLAALIARPIISRIGWAKSGVAVGQIAALENAIGLFATEYDRFPEDLDDLVNRPDDIEEERWSPPPIKAKDFKDPWGVQFLYRYPGEHRSFDLYTLGKDGQEGGEGENADVNNWE